MILVVFMSFRSSLKNWHTHGFAERELCYYDHLAQSGLEIYLVTYGDSRDLDILEKFYPQYKNNIKVLPLLPDNYNATRLASFSYTFKFLISNYTFLRNVDYLKSKQFSGSWLPALIAVFFRKRFIYRYGYDVKEFNMRNNRNRLRIVITKFVNGFVCKVAYKIMGTTKPLDKKKVKKFIHQENWIDWRLFANGQKEFNQKKFISNGRLEKQKNFEVLFRVLGDLGLSLTLIGTGSQEAKLKSCAAENKVDVTFLGRISYEQVANEFAHHDIFLSSTLFEGNPKTVIEALASGLICIVPSISSISSIIQDGENGFLHDNTETSIKEVIKKVDNLTQSAMSQISNNAIESVKERYSLVNIAEKELNIYRSAN